jgi:predicted transposase YbfD/YdcC
MIEGATLNDLRKAVPVLLSSLIDVPPGDLSGASAADDAARGRLRAWLSRVPDPRSRLGRWHPLEFVLAVTVCAYTAAGHECAQAVAEWAAGCSQQTLATLGGRRELLAWRIRPPGARTIARVLEKIDAEAFNAALYGYLASLRPDTAGDLPEVTRHEREQRRAAAAAREPGVPGLLRQAAADGKAVRGAIRPDGSQVHLLSVMDTDTGMVRAQREVDAKTNEIPELAPAIAHLDMIGQVVTADALHAQRETARELAGNKKAHYLVIVKANQPSLLAAITSALAGTDAEFAAAWAEEGKGHGRREKRTIRTAPATGIDWPHAAQVFRIRRDTGPTHGPWESKEIAYGITSLPAGLAGPRQLAFYARQHWGIENREHYVRDTTFREDAQKTRTGNQPNARAAIRNLVIGALRRAGHANIAHARRYYGRDDQRILALYGYT